MLLLQESKNILTSTLLVLLLLLCNATCFAHRHVDKKKPIPPKQPPTINVAIVGGGVAGAYAAYALWQANQVVPEYDLNITIFEASGRLGGRATAIEVDGHTVELGASMIYGGNYYLAGDLLKFGLQEKDDDGGSFALYDGKEVVFQSSKWGILTFVQLLVRYQFALLRYALLPVRAFWSFTRVYVLQSGGTSFNTTTELLEAQGLLPETKTSFARYAGATSPLTNELLGAINRCNYNQRNEELHALVGLVSTLPAIDFVQGSLQIQGGNAQIVRRLATHARAHVVLKTPVTHIAQAGDAWTLNKQLVYDVVIVATPLRDNETIQFSPPVPSSAYYRQKYITTVTHIIRGELKLGGADAVLPTNGAQTNWSCISKVGKQLYKVFSRDTALGDGEIRELFGGDAKLVAVHPWTSGAYPAYQKQVGADGPFVLNDDGLFYTSSIERVASAMEMSAIAGKNAALLATRYIEQRYIEQRVLLWGGGAV